MRGGCQNMVEVVNIKTCKDVGRPGDVYIGRKNVNFSESKWANPFPIGRCIVNDEEEHFNRETCIIRYMRYLSNGEVVNVNGKIWHGDLAKQSLHELKNAKRLCCWCSPLPCHGDFLKRLIISMQNQITLSDCGVI